MMTRADGFLLNLYVSLSANLMVILSWRYLVLPSFTLYGLVRSLMDFSWLVTLETAAWW